MSGVGSIIKFVNIKNMTENNVLPEPTHTDDLYVTTERINNPGYMMEDPQFSEQALKDRFDRRLSLAKKRFEEKYFINSR